MELLSFLKYTRLFSAEECETIDQSFEREMLDKGAVIQEESGYSQKIFFIESGLLRTFHLKDGRDITHFFFDENALIAPINSIFYNKSEPYGWETLEACQVKTIHYQNFAVLQEEIPALTKQLLDVAIATLHLYSQKIDLLQVQTAIERYGIFQEMYPNLLNRVSLGNITSFLGVTQQTLSVIRSKKT